MFLAAFLTRQIQILQVQRTNHASHVSRLYPSILHPVVWAFSLQAQHYTSAEVAMVLPWDFVNFEKQLLLWARRTGCGEGSSINILRQTQCFHHPFSWYKIYTWVYQHSWPPSFNILQTPGVGWNWDGHGVFFLPSVEAQDPKQKTGFVIFKSQGKCQSQGKCPGTNHIKFQFRRC